VPLGWTPRTEEDTAYGFEDPFTQLSVPNAGPRSAALRGFLNDMSSYFAQFRSELEATRVT
jgi:hypothetical protein